MFDNYQSLIRFCSWRTLDLLMVPSVQRVHLRQLISDQNLNVLNGSHSLGRAGEHQQLWFHH